MIFNPRRSKVKIFLPENDNIQFDRQKPVEVVLNADPGSKYEARLSYVAPQTSKNPQGGASFVAEAELIDLDARAEPHWYERFGRKAMQWFCVAAVAWVCSAPIIAAGFGRLSPWGWLNSLVAFPLVFAVVVLGFKTIHTCVLSSAVHRVISAAGAVADRLWDHSFSAGAACRELAKAAGLTMVEREEAFLAGLFHDVGKGVIAAKFPGVYGESLGVIGEAEKLGFHHGHLGHVLLSLWEIPETLRLAVAGHHQTEPDGLARITGAGDWLAWQVAPGVGAESPPEPGGFLAELKLGAAEVEELKDTVNGFLSEEKSKT